MSSVVLLEKDEGIGKIVINRPEALNALSVEVFEKLRELFDVVRNDDEIKVMILTGAGTAFSTGLDYSLLGGTLIENIHRIRCVVGEVQEILGMPEGIGKPSIAAVNGPAIGGGMELALSCDIRIASEDASFGLTEVCFGIIPGGGGAQRLPRIVGLGRAKEIIITGEPIAAQEAWRIGLVNRVVARDKLETAAKEMAGKIMENGPVAVEMSRMIANKSYDVDLKTILEFSLIAQEVCVRSQDLVDLYKKKLNKMKKKR